MGVQIPRFYKFWRSIMLNIKSILSYILSEVDRGSERIVKVDDEHFIDSKTGVEYHLYDNSFHMTHGGDEVISSEYLSKGEQEVVWAIKDLITDPDKKREKIEKYSEWSENARLKFSALYENPQPIVVKEPTVESDTEQYEG